MKPIWRKMLGTGLSLILFAVSAWLLHNELRAYHIRDILHAFDAIAGAYLWAAAGLTILSYAVMTGYDVLAMRYIRHPLSYSKIGLASFSLEGGARKGLRYTQRKLEKEGCRFEVMPPESVAAHLDELKNISDAWLTEKKTREKGFSLGFFQPDYIRRCPVALVIRNERIKAFANLWAGAQLEELSLDLMRYLPQAPGGVMEYLFTCLMLWGKAQGYRWFNLGMAPFSGLENRALAPLWNRIGAFVFRYGEHFYNFQGLRQYKEKFDPEWQAKYLASPGGLALPQIFANLATLISGGVKGVMAK